MFLLVALIASANSFQIPLRQTSSVVSRGKVEHFSRCFESKEDGVLELADDEEVVATNAATEEEKTVAPFLSQGEISEEAMTMDLNDPKQARVMFYIILSLLPVLFLIPLMLGSRELIPVEMLPPVEMN